MQSYSEYFRQRLEQQNSRIKDLESQRKNISPNVTGKKRKYEEAMGYQNDYEVVQDPESISRQNKGSNWIDTYQENLFNMKK
jgi:hypothetical protein